MIPSKRGFSTLSPEFLRFLSVVWWGWWLGVVDQPAQGPSAPDTLFFQLLDPSSPPRRQSVSHPLLFCHFFLPHCVPNPGQLRPIVPFVHPPSQTCVAAKSRFGLPPLFVSFSNSRAPPLAWFIPFPHLVFPGDQFPAQRSCPCNASDLLPPSLRDLKKSIVQPSRPLNSPLQPAGPQSSEQTFFRSACFPPSILGNPSSVFVAHSLRESCSFPS